MSQNSEAIKLILTLKRIPGVGDKTIQKALKDKPTSDISSSYDFAKSLGIPKLKSTNKGMWDWNKSSVTNYMNKAKRNHIHILTYMSPGYPTNLKNTANHNYPSILYAKGSLKPLQSKSVAIVGSRQMSPFSENVTGKLAHYFATKHFATIGGLAQGTDALAHRETIASGGHTVAVLAEGLDRPIAPRQNTGLAKNILQSGGTLVSTYPLGTPARGFQFAARDKWQSGIANGVVATKAGLHSGTSNTMRDAIKQGKPLGMPDYRTYGKIKKDPNLVKSSADTQQFLDKGIGKSLLTYKSIKDFTNNLNTNYKKSLSMPQKTLSTKSLQPNDVQRISKKVDNASEHYHVNSTRPAKPQTDTNTIKQSNGNLFNSKAQTIVNTVNTNGVMGKGLALQFKNKYPNMYKQYRNLCKQNKIKIGKPWLYKPADKNKHWVLNFPTKANWWNKSKLSYVQKGLQNLQQNYKKLGIKSIAIPPLGSGLGGLDYKKQVKPLMDTYLKQMDIPTYEYSSFKPSLQQQSKPTQSTKPQTQLRPNWTQNVYYVDKNNNLQKQPVRFHKTFAPYHSNYKARHRAQGESSINLRNAFKAQHPSSNPIEISSVSNSKIGREASAQQLSVYAKVKDPVSKDRAPQLHHYTVEQLFQAGKVFQNSRGQRYQKLSLLHTPSQYIKYDMRNTRKDKMVGFKLFGHKFPMTPKNYYYDWIYEHGLIQHPQLAHQLTKHNAFTDIWASKYTMNTQSKSCALYKAVNDKYGQNARAMLTHPSSFMKLEQQSDYQMSHPVSMQSQRPRQSQWHQPASSQYNTQNTADTKTYPGYTTKDLSKVFQGADENKTTEADRKALAGIPDKNVDKYFLNGQPTVLKEHNNGTKLTVPKNAMKLWHKHTKSDTTADNKRNNDTSTERKERQKDNIQAKTKVEQSTKSSQQKSNHHKGIDMN